MARNSRLSKRHPSKSRPSKLGRKWIQDDVFTYNIKVVYQDLRTFFDVTDLPHPDVANDALTGTAPDVSTSKDPNTSHMLVHMMRVAEPHDRETHTIDFVRELFDVLRYRTDLC